MARTSRFPGFYKITVEERRLLVSESRRASSPEEIAKPRCITAGLEAEPQRTSSSRTSWGPTRCRTVFA